MVKGLGIRIASNTRMYFCAQCGKILFKQDIFCQKHRPYPTKLYKRQMPNYVHYYFYPWSPSTRAMTYALKYGRHRPFLFQMKSRLQYLLQEEGFILDELWVTPNAKGLKKSKNHAYQIAKAFGAKTIHDEHFKQGTQKHTSRLQRRKLRIQGPRPQIDMPVIADDVLTTGATVEALMQYCGWQKAIVITMAYVSKRSINFSR